MRMGLNELVYWYQKKIGTYDKQQWEKTVEQRILDGLTHVPMKTAKLKTDFIDVDLVRGSSFPKAKPKHGLITVAYLAMQRLLFLPFHRKWWIQHTSSRVYILFLLLYCLQIINILLYFNQANRQHETDVVSMSEVLTPIIMMLTLCIVHSYIVSTNSGPNIIKDQSKHNISRRTRHGRIRFGKSRSRQSLRTRENTKSSQDTTSDKMNREVISSVRFAKKVTIENLLSTNQQQESVTAHLVCDNESRVSSTSKNNLLLSIPVAHAIPDDLPEENIENRKPVFLDDDGFESLNGNVSSDNDKSTGQSKQKGETTQASSDNDEEHVSNSDDFEEQLSPLIPKLPANLNLMHKEDNFSNNEEEPCNDKNNTEVRMGFRGNKQQCESEEEGECEEAATNHLTEATTSATEWMGVTTNSDECSYSSELEESDLHSETNLNHGEFVDQPFSWEFELPPSILLSSTCSPSDRVSCTIWTRRDVKKAELSVLDISSAIIARVESMPESLSYFYGGLVLSIMLSLVPSIRRLNEYIAIDNSTNMTIPSTHVDFSHVKLNLYYDVLFKLIDVAFGATICDRMMVLISAIERLTMSCLFFFLMTVAERSYKQRLLYAKLFSHLTSSRRARKSDLPHFRLNKVRNIKTWLSVRSYLKRRGPQRSVDIIVSAAFIITLLLLSFVCLELIKDMDSLHLRYNIEALFWSFSLGIFILRFMTLGTKINKKYRNLSVLITEQINLYLQIEQKPHKKDELMVANSVLKLAADLIKELESPFKISGLSANPYVYTITKVVLLSALSGVLSEVLGFKLKLHKIKIK